AAAELEFLDGALAVIENHAAQMIFHFRRVLLYVGEGAEEALLFSGEEHETNGAAGTLSAFQDGFGGGENADGSGAVVRGAFAQIPGIEMSADDDDFFGMFAADEVTDYVCGFDRAASERVLHVDADTHGFPGGEETFELAFVFHG